MSNIIQCIKSSVILGRYRFSEHAREEADNDYLTIEEIVLSLEDGELIEDYPLDFPYPSCLILSHNKKKEPIHSVWGYNSEANSSVLVTVYRPDLTRWIDFKKRRR